MRAGRPVRSCLSSIRPKHQVKGRGSSTSEDSVPLPPWLPQTHVSCLSSFHHLTFTPDIHLHPSPLCLELAWVNTSWGLCSQLQLGLASGELHTRGEARSKWCWVFVLLRPPQGSPRTGSFLSQRLQLQSVQSPVHTALSFQVLSPYLLQPLIYQA